MVSVIKVRSYRDTFSLFISRLENLIKKVFETNGLVPSIALNFFYGVKHEDCIVLAKDHAFKCKIHLLNQIQGCDRITKPL